MRLAAFASLLMVSACTAFDGLQAEVPAEAAGAVGANGTETSTSATAPEEGESASTSSSSTSAAEANAANPDPSAPSCAQKHGGMTCGPKGDGDCCAIATQGAVKLGKYMITAGRMRAFVDKVNGDVAGFVKGLPADKWKPEWTSNVLPTDRASADVALGPAGKKACEQGSSTGHTYWTPKTDADFSDYDQATLDEKALNCVPWPLAQALCAFDGGHLPSMKDVHAAFTNDGATKFPWGDDAINPSQPDPQDRLNNQFGFVTEPNPAKFRGDDGHPFEVSFFIAPPGRFPAGDNKAGVADAAGNLLEWVSDSPRQFVWKGDFEQHAANAATFNALSGGSIWSDGERGVFGSKPWIWGTSQLAGNAGNDGQKDGYYSIGARCAF